MMRSANVKTKRSTESLREEKGWDTAFDWAHDVYGKYFDKERAERAKKSTIVEHTTPMTEVYDDCMTRRPTDKTPTEWHEWCTYYETSVQGFHDRDKNTIHVHKVRDTPETMLHEMLHALAHPNVDKLLSTSRWRA